MENNEIAEKIKESLEKDNEGVLLWDEYKYRHDLIWKHLIRSTMAAITLVMVPYSQKLDVSKFLILMTSAIALCYLLFTMVVIYKELKLFNQIKTKHRKRQWLLFGLHKSKFTSDGEPHLENGFGIRVWLYLGGLSLIVVVACAINICSNWTR